MDELKPCPFCGGKMKVVNFMPHRPDGYWQGLCSKCGIKTKYIQTIPDATTAINRRPAPENKPMLLPDVSERDRQSVYDFLHDCFAEWISDPTAGLHGMNAGEAILANSIMSALASGCEENKPPCYTAEKDNPYPLCVGRGMTECAHCCLWVYYEPEEDESRVNKPLTLDQLRQMDGEPVWWWNKSAAPQLTICSLKQFDQTPNFISFDWQEQDCTEISNYQTLIKQGYKPYARKPEQEEKTMPNEMNHADLANRILYLDSQIESDDDVRALAQAAADERRIANGELKPLVHGRWKRQYKSGVIVSSGFVCSVCDCWGSEYETDFCPRCGALMDGKDDSHEAD